MIQSGIAISVAANRNPPRALDELSATINNTRETPPNANAKASQRRKTICLLHETNQPIAAAVSMTAALAITVAVANTAALSNGVAKR
jgi:hypothetical protein